MNWDKIIKSGLSKLSSYRPVFFSEADFQFALAWELQKSVPEAQIRLEYCPADVNPSMHIDTGGEIKLNFHEAAKWIEKSQLKEFDFAPADIPVWKCYEKGKG